MHATLDRELRAGLPHLAGTAIDVSLNVTEATVNGLLAQAGKGRDLVIRVQADNRLVVHYGALFGTVYVDDRVEVSPSPTVRLTLASRLFALGLQFAPRMPNVTVSGSDVRIDVGGFVPAGYRAALRHVRDATITTSPGVLVVTFRVRVA